MAKHIPRVVLTVLLLTCCAVCQLALATGNSANYWVYGLGRQSCESFQQAREHGGYADIAYKNWISGYLTAVNSRSAVSPGVAGSKQFADMLAWLEDYCASHGQQPLFIAVEEMTASFTGTQPKAE